MSEGLEGKKLQMDVLKFPISEKQTSDACQPCEFVGGISE